MILPPSVSPYDNVDFDLVAILDARSSHALASRPITER